MRLQLALNVKNLDSAIAYYSKMFDAEPHKIRKGYANFAIDNPALKLVLFENPEQTEPFAATHLRKINELEHFR